jgi:hypothetical protein
VHERKAFLRKIGYKFWRDLMVTYYR